VCAVYFAWDSCRAIGLASSNEWSRKHLDRGTSSTKSRCVTHPGRRRFTWVSLDFCSAVIVGSAARLRVMLPGGQNFRFAREPHCGGVFR
jgi:hypothetical protein